MATVRTRSQTVLAAVLMMAAAALLVAGCSGPQGSLEQLTVTQYRWNNDEEHDVVRVVGQVRNGGEHATPAAEIVVTLYGRTGSQKGSNRTELPSLEGGAEHRFDLAITSHGNVETVDIAIVPPGTAIAEQPAEGEGEGGGAENAPSNSAAEEGG